MRMRRAIFLDRDGVINKVLLNNGKPFSPRSFEDFELFPEVGSILNFLKKMGFINIIVTNQPDIARGLMKMKELNKMHALIQERLPIDDIMVCPHDDADNCDCRKPKYGMLLEAADKWNIDLKKSYLVGDAWKDMEAGKQAGCRTIIIDMPYNKEVAADFRVKDVCEVMRIILEISDVR